MNNYQERKAALLVEAIRLRNSRCPRCCQHRMEKLARLMAEHEEMTREQAMEYITGIIDNATD